MRKLFGELRWQIAKRIWMIRMRMQVRKIVRMRHEIDRVIQGN